MLRQMGKQLKPLEERVFGEGHFLRPSFIQFMNCQNILISDITLTNVPFWVIHPTYCSNITIRNIHVNSYRINNDGIDLDSCEDVLVEDCTFRAGDDAMVIKSGRDQDAWKVGKPSKNIVVRNCFASEVLHGLAFGSEMSGGLENIYIDNFHLKKVEQYAIQFKSNLDRGGYIRNVYIDGVFIDETKTAIFFTNDYHSYSGGNSPSEFSGIEIKNVICNKASGKAIDIVGLEQKPIHNILLENIMIVEEGEKSEILNVVESEFTNIKISKRDFINKTNAEPHTIKH
jgi:polygalacturonase